jgi:septum site-determining protein MinC
LGALGTGSTGDFSTNKFEPSKLDPGKLELSCVVVARGTGDGLFLRLDGRASGEALRSAVSEFLNTRKGFLAGSEISFEWLNGMPPAEMLEVLFSYIKDEFNVSIKDSSLFVPSTASPPTSSLGSKIETFSVNNFSVNNFSVNNASEYSISECSISDKNAAEKSSTVSSVVSSSVPVPGGLVNRGGEDGCGKPRAVARNLRAVSPITDGDAIKEQNKGIKVASINSTLGSKSSVINDGDLESGTVCEDDFTETASRRPTLFDGIQAITDRDSHSGDLYGASAYAQQLSAASSSAMSTSFIDRGQLAVDPSLWDDPDARIIFTTLRSGQKIETEHSLIVLGDVNSGAELIAGGDIIVLGTLRGIAHAGAYDESGGGRVIFALNLDPTQLRIGTTISRGAKEGAFSSSSIATQDGDRVPEVARADGGTIVVENYAPRGQWSRRRVE